METLHDLKWFEEYAVNAEILEPLTTEHWKKLADLLHAVNAAAAPTAPTTPEPCRRAYSRSEMFEQARAYICVMFGPCSDAQDQSRWLERLGLLTHFIINHFPPPGRNGGGML